MQGMIDLLAAAAHAFRRHQASQVPRSGLAVDTLLELFESHRGTGQMTRDERSRVMLILQQVLLATPAPSQGNQHDAAATTALLADFLAARHAVRLLRHNPGAIAAAMGDPQLPATPAFEQSLAQEFQDDPALARAVVRAAGDASNGQAFSFIRRIAAAAIAPPMAAPASSPGKNLLERLVGWF